MKKVLDGDTMKCLETFDESQTQDIFEKYQKLGKYNDISVDIDGDIILYEE